MIPRIPSKILLLLFMVVVSALCSLRCFESSPEKEQTLAIIKPDGLFGNYSDQIKTLVLDSGFIIFKEKALQLDEEGVQSFYGEHSSKGFFHSLVKYMTSGPVIIMVLEKENAVADWRSLIGPTDARKAKITHPHSIRAMCGTDMENNCVHGSDSPQSAQREISFFFKESEAGQDNTKHDGTISCSISQYTVVQSPKLRSPQKDFSCLCLLSKALIFMDRSRMNTDVET